MILLTIIGALCFALTALKVMFLLTDLLLQEASYTVATVGTMRINQCALIKSSNNLKKVRGFRA
jgi:hypothetical protein